MPFRKKYRSAYRKKSRSGYRSKAVARIARRVVNRAVETKEARYTYTNIGGVSLTSISYGSGSIVAGLYGAIGTGTGSGQRVGQEIKATFTRYYLAMQPADDYNNLRLLFVSPKTQGVRYQPSDIANFVQNLLSQSGSGTNQWCAPVDTHRFHVYRDYTINVRKMPLDGSSTSTVPQTRIIRGGFRCPKKIVFDDGGVITSDVYLVALSDSGAIAHPGAIAGFISCYYKDA